MTSLRLFIPVGLACFIVQAGPGQQAPLHVLASNGMKAVIEELQPRIERSIGHLLAIEYGSTAGLIERVDQGETFDVAVLTSEGLDALMKKGKAGASEPSTFARSGIGLAVRSGAPKPDITTSAALKRTLELASSITYAGDGASRPAIDRMLEQLGLAEQLKPKIVLTKGSGAAMSSVAAGRVAIVMTLMSELMPVKGIDIAGPLPPPHQSYVRFAAGVGTQASQPDAAKAFIKFLESSEAAPAYREKGMEYFAGRL